MEVIVKVYKTALPLISEWTAENLMIYQWRDLYVAQNQSIKYSNLTTPGFIEYGGFLREYHSNFTSKLTNNQVLNLLAVNDPLSDNPQRIPYSLLNKSSIDNIYSVDNPAQFINKTLNIDLEEANYIYKYLQYLSGELAFAYSIGGTKGMGTLTQLVAPKLADSLIKMGHSLFVNHIKLNSFHNYYGTVDCTLALQQNFFWPDANITNICENSKLDTKNINNLLVWLEGVLFGSKNLQTLLGCTDLQYLYLTGSNSKMKQSLMFYVNNFMTIHKEFIRGSNYKSADYMYLAGYQWLTSKITTDFPIEKYQASSISNTNWDSTNFPSNYIIKV